MKLRSASPLLFCQKVVDTASSWINSEDHYHLVFRCLKERNEMASYHFHTLM